MKLQKYTGVECETDLDCGESLMAECKQGQCSCIPGTTILDFKTKECELSAGRTSLYFTFGI